MLVFTVISTSIIMVMTTKVISDDSEYVTETATETGTDILISIPGLSEWFESGASYRASAEVDSDLWSSYNDETGVWEPGFYFEDSVLTT